MTEKAHTRESVIVSALMAWEKRACTEKEKKFTFLLDLLDREVSADGTVNAETAMSLIENGIPVYRCDRYQNEYRYRIAVPKGA